MVFGDHLLQETGSVASLHAIGGTAPGGEVENRDLFTPAREGCRDTWRRFSRAWEMLERMLPGFAVGDEERHDRRLVAGVVALVEALTAPGDAEQVVRRRGDRQRQVDDHVGVLAHDARGALGSLQVAGGPVPSLGDGDSSIRILDDPGVLAAAALRGVDHERPLASAHRVEPAVGDVAVVAREDERAEVDVAGLELAVAQRGCGRELQDRAGRTQLRGSASTAATAAAAGRRGPLADHQAVAAALVGRLHHQLARRCRRRSASSSS